LKNKVTSVAPSPSIVIVFVPRVDRGVDADRAVEGLRREPVGAHADLRGRGQHHGGRVRDARWILDPGPDVRSLASGLSVQLSYLAAAMRSEKPVAPWPAPAKKVGRLRTFSTAWPSTGSPERPIAPAKRSGNARRQRHGRAHALARPGHVDPVVVDRDRLRDLEEGGDGVREPALLLAAAC
jgi:hypothetical protein